MACPTCSHTMKCISSREGDRATYWCSRCGTIKDVFDDLEERVEVPFMVERIASVAGDISTGCSLQASYVTSDIKTRDRLICLAAELNELRAFQEKKT